MQRVGSMSGEAEQLLSRDQPSDCTDLGKAVGRAGGSGWCCCWFDLFMHTVYLLEICTRQQLTSLLLQQRAPRTSLAAQGCVDNGCRQCLLLPRQSSACIPVWISILVKFISESSWKKKSTLKKIKSTPSILASWRTLLFSLCYCSWSPVGIK